MDTLGSRFFALSDSTRRSILQQLTDRGPACVGELAAPFDLSLNAVSKHIKILEGAGFVQRRRKGRQFVLEARVEPLRDIAQWMHRYERYWNRQLDPLESVFTKKGA